MDNTIYMHSNGITETTCTDNLDDAKLIAEQWASFGDGVGLTRGRECNGPDDYIAYLPFVNGDFVGEGSRSFTHGPWE